MSTQTDADDPQLSGDPQQSRKRSRRAGQACDRCRSRKIKCDGKLPSCSPCESAKVLCKTTDRTSNRTVPRGYLETLEFKVAEQERLQNRIHELEARLRDLDPSINHSSISGSAQQFLTPPETSTLQSAQQDYLTPAIESNQSHSPLDQSYPDDRLSDIRTKGSMVANAGADQDANTDPGVFEADEAGKGWYLGCASGMIYMNSIKNTASSVLGIELDLSEFSPLSKSVSGKSMPSLLSELHSHRSRKPVKPILPPKDIGLELVNDFFGTINLLCPMLHRPSFYKELDRCYDDPTYTPSSAFIVQYNMIMAIAARVRPPSQYHYPGVTPSHYPLASAQAKPKHPSTLSEIASRPPSKISHDQFYNRMLPYFPDLLHEPGLSELQALILLMVYLIGIYKMGHLWHLSRIVSAVAFELGLHRSDANWSNFNPLEREMRKRVYFLILGLDLKVSNSLGRPPSFRLQDSDVSLPSYMDDEYIDETGSKPMPEGQIPQLAPAIQLAILIRINSSVTEKLFSVFKGRGQRERYVAAVLALEKELMDWKDRLPAYIDFDVNAPPDKTPFWIANAGLFLMYNELRLLIRHPSMGRLSPSPAFFAESLSICAEASQNILAIISRFREFRQLECHPQSVSTIILATLTILYSLWEKKNETTKHEIEKEMQLPLEILDEIGQTYGPTRKLHQALANLVAATIANLERSRNGTDHQSLSFSSPAHALDSRSMQLPIRIDPSLQLKTAGLQKPIPPTTVKTEQFAPHLQENGTASAALLGWQEPLNGRVHSQSENQAFPHESASRQTPALLEQDQISLHDGFEDSMLWGPSLEWTGGWDDFLNAIAM